MNLRLIPYLPRLWWARLWIRKHEFHSSLYFDNEAFAYMSEEQQQRYVVDIILRRKIARIKARLSDLRNYNDPQFFMRF